MWRNYIIREQLSIKFETNTSIAFCQIPRDLDNIRYIKQSSVSYRESTQL